MSVCKSYGCDSKAAPGNKYCPRCWEELQAMSRPENQRRTPWATLGLVVLMVAAAVAASVLL